MRRSTVARALALAIWVPAAAPVPAIAADRLDRAAAALARSPLFVHPDVLWLVGRQERTAIAADLRRSRVPILVAVLPVIPEDESFGDARRILFGLHRRLGRRAVLAVVDERGSIDVETFGVPRDIRLSSADASLYRSSDEPLALRERLAAVVAAADRAPPGPAAMPKPAFAAGPSDDERGSPLVAVVVLGVALGAMAHGAVRGAVALADIRRRRRAR